MVAGKTYDHTADVWSIGVLTYELLVGSTPFTCANQEETYKRIVKAPVPFTSSQMRNIPNMSVEAKDFIRKLLAKNPKKRMSLDTLFQHPWVVNNAIQSIDDDIEENSIEHSGSLTPRSMNKPTDVLSTPTSDRWKSYLLPSISAKEEKN